MASVARDRPPAFAGCARGLARWGGQRELAIRLRPRNAGPNTAADHLEVLADAIAQVAAGHRGRLLIRGDSAATRAMLDCLTGQISAVFSPVAAIPGPRLIPLSPYSDDRRAQETTPTAATDGPSSCPTNRIHPQRTT